MNGASRTLGSLVLIALGSFAVLVFLRFGTTSPCGVLRAEVREEASREHGLDAVLATLLPNSVIDAMVASYYGGDLTPGRCIAALFGAPAMQRPAISPPSVAHPTSPASPWSQNVRRPNLPMEPYAEPLWNIALARLFGSEATAVYEQNGKQKHRVWFAYPYEEGGCDKVVVFTSTIPEDPRTHRPRDCRACGAIIGAITFEKRGAQWIAQTSQMNVGTFGEGGTVQNVSGPQRIQLNAHSFALLIDFDYGHMGGRVSGKQIFAHTEAGWHFIGGFFTHDDYNSPLPGGAIYGFDANYNVERTSDDSYPTIRVMPVGTTFDLELRRVVPARPLTYVFDGTKYVKVAE